MLLLMQALKVYVPSYESYGRMWPHMHLRIIAALIVYQVSTFGYIGLRKFVYAPLLVPAIVFSFIFAFVCRKRFYLAFAHTPLEVASQGKKKGIPNMEAIYTTYIPQCLINDKFEESDSFEDAHSQSLRTASF